MANVSAAGTVRESFSKHTHVIKLRYSAVTDPYLLLVHSVNTNPSGHFLLITGPISPKTSSGSADETA